MGEVRSTPASRGQHIKVHGAERALCLCVCLYECVSRLARNRATSAYKMCNVLKCPKTLGARKRERLSQ